MAVYVRKANIEAAPMQEETILYDPAAKAFCVLNPTAAFIWEQLAAPRTEPELSAGLRERFDVEPSSDVDHDVRTALSRLESLAMIAVADSVPSTS